MAESFVHLHQHTEFSMLDGASRISEVVEAAAQDGQPALGITDHGNLYGALDFYSDCKAAGIKPVIGIELYQAKESRSERPARSSKSVDTLDGSEVGEKAFYHLTALAETTEGYWNLVKLSSEAFLSGFHFKPRVDWELLDRFHSGLIVTTGCLGGLVGQALLADRLDEAIRIAARLQDIFGKENLFVELQDHGLIQQQQVTPGFLEVAKAIGAPLLATNDSHYVHRSDAATHDALLCVQTGARVSDEKRFRFEGTEHYLKTAAEMRELFAEFPEACDNSLLIAERANVDIEFGVPTLPPFPIPDDFAGETDEERAAAYLRHLTLEGARDRYGDPLPQKVTERIDYELGVIKNMGFSTYFLVVWDLIRYANEQGIRVGPGRGSAAGCCVAYSLGIVKLDPIRYDLLFERFLNPGRLQMPDIDMDFDERYRGEMIRYATERYGSDRVAQIITFSRIKSRAAVRDGARVLGFEYAVGDKVAKAMPPMMMGRNTPIAACLEKTPGYEAGYAAAGDLRGLYTDDPEVKKVIDVAAGLEGLVRQDGIHASAVVITGKPLLEYLPVQRKPDSSAPDGFGPLVTQYEMHGVEALGLLKMDFLGLSYLTVIEHALDLIEQSTGIRPDIDAVPLDDEKTLELLRRADTFGVFQLESGQMRTLIRRLAPTSFDDIAALVALYRPGPLAANMHNDYADRKNGRQEITYVHPELEGLLSDTQGLMIYQESMMRVAQHFAGYSLEESDNLRKATGKKIREVMQAEREKFVAGCERTGYGKELGTKLFDVIEPFADYAFNKSHSYGYGLIAYQTAWLKAHHSVEYFAALLTAVSGDKEKTAVYLAELRAKGIAVLVPDVNRSGPDFGVDRSGTEPAITYGLAAVRNVGEAIISLIVAERETNGPYADFFDFVARADQKALNKRAVESLIKAGAFDSLGHPRKGLLMVHDAAITEGLRRRHEEALGIQSLFGAIDEPVSPGDQATETPSNTDMSIPEIEFERSERLANEKEMLGLYVSDHPLMGLEHALATVVELPVRGVRELLEEGVAGFSVTPAGEVRTTGGIITDLVHKRTKKGDMMATFVLEDLESAIEVIVFPKDFVEYQPFLENDTIVTVRGRLDVRDDRVQLICIEVRVPELVEGEAPELRIELLPEAFSDAMVLERLKRVLSAHPGHSAVVVSVGERTFRLPAAFNVTPKPALMADLERVLTGSAAA